MSYKEKPQLKLYKYENNSFILQAIIDDYQECSFEDNLYEAGQFSISINFNIPNSQLFQRGLFIQFGNSWKFGEITKIQDQIGEEGKGSQFRIITGFDARYILKRRVIKNMNSNGLWVMTGKGEIVLRNLINDQCGTNAENKRKLPIVNTIPSSSNAVGKEYSASEQFSNLYEVCKTIATQSEIGWRLEFNGTSLNLVCFEGTDRTQTVQFSTSFDSLANGEFIDSSESFANAIYVGGKGQNDDRDIYEGESAIEGDSPAGLDRFESWDNQSSMTTESEYETEALSMLNQYGQTLTMSGNGLAKCPYEYEKEYFTGDKIKIAFSGKSANAQILSVTEHWAFGAYEINFSFGKPLPDLNAQLQLMLRKIQTASNKTNSKDSVRWYDIPTDTAMPASDVTYNTIGFIGNVGEGATFTLYRDSSGTGSKTYHVYFKQLGGSGKLTLTTGVSGASNLVMNAGTYVAIIYVDENGNITSQGMTATGLIQTGNNQPATSGAVAEQTEVTKSSDSTPYSQRVNADKDKSFINKLIGASFAINQLVKNGNFANTSGWSSGVATISISNNVARVTYAPNITYNQDLRQVMPNIVMGHKYFFNIEHRESTPNVNEFVFNEVSNNTTYLSYPMSKNWALVQKVFTPSTVNTASAKRITPRLSVANYGGSWFEVRNFYIIDLTQMFGSAIADRIYAMEQATEGSGIAWIKSFGFFNNSYYATDEGSVQNVKPSALRTTGKNFLNVIGGKSEGVYVSNTGNAITANGTVSYVAFRILEPVDWRLLMPKGRYKITGNLPSNFRITISQINDGNWSSLAQAYGSNFAEFELTDSVQKIGITVGQFTSGENVNLTFYPMILAVGNTDTTYKPYEQWNYPLADTELRGIPKLDSNNNLYFDGDIYYPNGDVIRKYASLTNQSGAVGETITLTGYKTNGNIICSKGAISNIGTISGTTLNLTSAISGETIIYELATPTKETVAGYSNPHTLIRKGAEEFVDERTVPLPVGHETEYAQLPGWLSNNVIFL